MFVTIFGLLFCLVVRRRYVDASVKRRRRGRIQGRDYAGSMDYRVGHGVSHVSVRVGGRFGASELEHAVLLASVRHGAQRAKASLAR